MFKVTDSKVNPSTPCGHFFQWEKIVLLLNKLLWVVMMFSPFGRDAEGREGGNKKPPPFAR
tara:strand:- start:2561 stop:2743 length:183 start_codon:yes stop_codon:yes gene_type:complete